MPNILITGATKGIGLALARQFSAGGFHVVGCASTPASIEAVRQTDPEMELHQVDLSAKAAVKAFAARLVEEHGRFEVIANNAGRFLPGELHNEDDDTFEQLMALNLNAGYYLTKGLLGPMIEAQRGTLLNICSTASIEAYANGGSYCISKHAQLGLSRVLREELKPHNIRVVSLLPGPTFTASWEGVQIPEERFLRPKDVAELAWSAYNFPQGSVAEELVLRPMKGNIQAGEF